MKSANDQQDDNGQQRGYDDTGKGNRHKNIPSSYRGVKRNKIRKHQTETKAKQPAGIDGS